MSGPLLSAEGLHFRYGGVVAVRNVSLSLAPGEVLAVIGPNGAGKSTCFNLLSGQLRPSQGSIRLAGEDVTSCPPADRARRGIARTFQVATVFSSMTVRENVQAACLSATTQTGRLLGRADHRHGARADALLADVGLAEQAARGAATLAYGDAKRLELAMALAGEPRVLLMDEPTAGMGLQERHGLMRFAVETARTRGAGLLFTEHDMDIVFGHADRVLVMSRGEIVAAGPPAEIRRDPLVRALYLGEGAQEGGDAAR